MSFEGRQPLNRKVLEDAVAGFAKRKVLVVGDVMLDRFIDGTVHRISPEAPVPVVLAQKETFYPGGAANVARNLVGFANETRVAGIIGEDEAGRRLCESLQQAGSDTKSLLPLKHFPTIRKTRIVAQHQQVVRIDWETALRLREADRTRFLTSIMEQLQDEIDVMILEDYAKGLFDQEMASALIECANSNEVLVTVDPHPSNPLDWRGAHAVKPNRREAFEAAGATDDSDAPPLANEPLLEVGRCLLERWAAPHLLVTLGDEGMVLFEPGKDPHHIPTRAQEVFDVSGAGDTAIAFFSLAMASGLGSRTAAELANLASGLVVEKLGTASLSPQELLQGW